MCLCTSTRKTGKERERGQRGGSRLSSKQPTTQREAKESFFSPTATTRVWELGRALAMEDSGKSIFWADWPPSAILFWDLFKKCKAEGTRMGCIS